MYKWINIDVRWVILTIVLILPIYSTAQITFERTYGGADSDECESVQQTTDGGFIIAGSTSSFGSGWSDFYLIKTDRNGDTLWTNTYGGPNTDRAYSVKQTFDGGFILAGCTRSFGSGLDDFWLIKTDSIGNEEWNKTFGGSSSYEIASDVQQTFDGGYILAGFTNAVAGAGNYDFWLVKTDSIGTREWSQMFGGNGSDRAECVVQTFDGGYILAGYTQSFGAGSFDFWLIKTDSSGNEEWNRTFGGSSGDRAYHVQQTSDGGYILVGATESFGAGYNDIFLIKTDSNGDSLWAKIFGGSSGDKARAVQQTLDGGYILAGYTSSFGSEGGDFWLIKTDSGGNMEWSHTFGRSNSNDGAHAVKQTGDGGYIIAGNTYYFGSAFSDFYLVKTEENGYILRKYSITVDVPDPSTITVNDSSTVTATILDTLGNRIQGEAMNITFVSQLGLGIFGQVIENNDTTYSAIYVAGNSTGIDTLWAINPVCAENDSAWTTISIQPSGINGAVIFHKPKNYYLAQNYPNPFNQQTNIRYQLLVNGKVTLNIFNTQGQLIKTLFEGLREAGSYETIWHGRDERDEGVASGVYFYRLEVCSGEKANFMDTKKMVLLR